MTLDPANRWPPLRCPGCVAEVRAGAGGYACGCGWTAPIRDGIAEVVRDGISAGGFPGEWMDRQAAWEEEHFWPQGRKLLLGDLVVAGLGGASAARGRRFLEIGSGVGTVLAHLASLGLVVTGCEAYRAGLAHARRRVPGAALLAGDATGFGFDSWYDGAGLFDVLEHLDDEGPLLAACRRALRPGGRLFVTVPAYAWLYGLRDRIGGHRRRYVAGKLRAVLELAGFRVLRVGYFSTLLLPLFAAARLVERLRQPSPGAETGRSGTDLEEARSGAVANAVGRFAFALERAWLRAADLPAGTSVLAVAEREG